MTKQAYRLFLMACGLIGWTVFGLISVVAMGPSWPVLLGQLLGCLMAQGLIFVVAPRLWRKTYGQ